MLAKILYGDTYSYFFFIDDKYRRIVTNGQYSHLGYPWKKTELFNIEELSND